jgi:hypothetical protein
MLQYFFLHLFAELNTPKVFSSYWLAGIRCYHRLRIQICACGERQPRVFRFEQPLQVSGTRGVSTSRKVGEKLL